MENNKLYILWTGGDKEHAKKVVLRYTKSVIEKKQWYSVVLLIWGASEKLAVEDDEIRQKVIELISEGVEVKAGIICADEYGISDQLTGMGVKLDVIGDLVSDILKKQKTLLSL